jgi:hypothetical protein
MVKQYFFLILLLVFILVPIISVSAYNSGFQPVYQPPTPPGNVVSIHDIGNVTSSGCAAGQILKANASAIWACAADDTGAGGEVNTASSSGVGYSLVLPKLGVDLPFRGIFCAGDLSCSSNSTDVRISYTSTASGGNVTNLNDAGDVVLTSPSIFSILYYNGVNWIDQIFKLNSKTCSAGQFVSDVNNQTGAITCSTPTGSGNMTVLGDGGDVTITSPTPLSVLYYVGSQWIDKIFSINTQSASNDIFVTGINNQTGAITTNQFSVNTVSANGGDTFVNSINNVTGAVTTKVFSVNLKTCSGTDKVSSIDNSTGNVICTTDSTGSGSGGIPLPPKKWGELIPRSASTSLQGLLTGCSILATATYVYDTTDNSNAILSTTAVTDGINGGIHCSGTNFNNFRGDQNAYMYSKVEWNKITTNRVYVGFVNSATHLPNNAETILDNLSGVGLCVRTTDTLLQWCRNDGDATTDYVSTGVTETAGTVYRIIISTVDSGVTWCGSINESQTCWTTEIPATTTQMYADSTGETDGGATAILWTQYIFYVQSDK